MSSALTQVIPSIHRRVLNLYKDGAKRIALKGSRRCGKSWYLGQRELTNTLAFGVVVNIATQTAEQGRLGMFADCCSIIDGTDEADKVLKVLQSPREIRCPHNGGVVHFSTYPNPERAKGIACDDVVINEANNFTLKQVQDIIANARDCVFFDYNQSPGWRAKIIPDEAVVMCVWQDNPYLTAAQLEYFETLKRNAERPDATPYDIWAYRVYYLGIDADLEGAIFPPSVFRWCAIPERLSKPIVYCDPSSLRNGDYFACVLSGVKDDAIIVADTYSPNVGGWDDIVYKLREWASRYTDLKIYVEMNGFVGGEFYRYAQKAIPLKYYISTRNKYERIVSNYSNLTGRVLYADTEANRNYMEQVYQFSKTCEHDDNADALDASFRLHRYLKHIS